MVLYMEVDLNNVLSITQARSQLAELVRRVNETGDQVVLTKHGKPVAVLAAYRPFIAHARLSEEEAQKIKNQIIAAYGQPMNIVIKEGDSEKITDTITAYLAHMRHRGQRGF